MNKTFICAILALVLLSATAMELTIGEPKDISGKHPMCNICVQGFNQFMNNLVNYIINGGIVGTCAELCGHLDNKLEVETCNLLCDVVGIKEFMHILQKADLDAIWACEEIHLCPTAVNPAVNILETMVKPVSGPQGTKFALAMEFEVVNATGTGEIGFSIVPPKGQPIGELQMNTGIPVGKYPVEVAVSTQNSEQMTWSAGQYDVYFVICEGTCGSHHHGAKTLAQSMTSFTITA